MKGIGGRQLCLCLLCDVAGCQYAGAGSFGRLGALYDLHDAAALSKSVRVRGVAIKLRALAPAHAWSQTSPTY